MATILRVSDAHKSTNVRSLVFARLALTLLQRIAPQMAAAVGERLFFTPPRPRRSKGEALLKSADLFRLRIDGAPVVTYRWGKGPVVVLMHGWGGRAAQMSSFVEPLLRRGFSVIAFDAPGHGRSGGSISSGPHFATALTKVVEMAGGAHGVVAHSLAAAATALAMSRGLDLRRVVFIAAPANPPSWVLPFAEKLGLAPNVIAMIREKSERRLRFRWADLDIPSLAARFRAPLLVIQDRDDRNATRHDASAIVSAWPNAGLMETSGLGHNRILRDREVVERAAEYMIDGVDRACACGAPIEGVGSCENCRIERELFDRDTRWESRHPTAPPVEEAARAAPSLSAA